MNRSTAILVLVFVTLSTLAQDTSGRALEADGGRELKGKSGSKASGSKSGKSRRALDLGGESELEFDEVELDELDVDGVEFDESERKLSGKSGSKASHSKSGSGSKASGSKSGSGSKASGSKSGKSRRALDLDGESELEFEDDELGKLEFEGLLP